MRFGAPAPRPTRPEGEPGEKSGERGTRKPLPLLLKIRDKIIRSMDGELSREKMVDRSLCGAGDRCRQCSHG
jgi:hypothetical protein